MNHLITHILCISFIKSDTLRFIENNFQFFKSTEIIYPDEFDISTEDFDELMNENKI